MKNITILTLLFLLGFSSCITSHTSTNKTPDKNPGRGGASVADIFLNLQRQPNGNYAADLSLYDPGILIESIQNTNSFNLDVRHVSYYNQVKVAALSPNSISSIFSGQIVKGRIEAAITSPVNPWPAEIGVIIRMRK